MQVELKGQSLCFDGDPDKLKLSEVDDLFKQISFLLDATYTGVTLSGCWVIYRNGEIVTGDKWRGQKRRRKFTLAIADATGLGTVSYVS